jgi:hypothetical protein
MTARTHFKHEDEGASPKMAKRLEDVLGRRTEGSSAGSSPATLPASGEHIEAS